VDVVQRSLKDVQQLLLGKVWPVKRRGGVRGGRRKDIRRRQLAPIGTRGRPVLLLLVGGKALGVLTEVSARPALDDVRKAGGDPERLRLFQAVLLIEVLDIAAGFGVRELVPTTRGRERKADTGRWERSRDSTPENGGSRQWGYHISRGQS
jgi:hypothetical protein